MKTFKLIVIGMVMFFASTVQAQVSVSVNVGTPPLWGPVGYTEARYYYLPDVEAYYDVQSSMFIYYSGGAWIQRTYLPSRYRNYDLYGGYKVVMTDYHGNTPYIHHKEYKSKYGRGYHGQPQKTYGERPGNQNSKARTGTNSHSNQKVSTGNRKSAGHGNVQGKTHSNNKNMNKNNGRGGGKGKK